MVEIHALRKINKLDQSNYSRYFSTYFFKLGRLSQTNPWWTSRQHRDSSCVVNGLNCAGVCTFHVGKWFTNAKFPYFVIMWSDAAVTCSPCVWILGSLACEVSVCMTGFGIVLLYSQIHMLSHSHTLTLTPTSLHTRFTPLQHTVQAHHTYWYPCIYNGSTLLHTHAHTHTHSLSPFCPPHAQLHTRL